MQEPLSRHNWALRRGAKGLCACARAGDVGLARIMDATHLATGLAPCGTFAYAAPEMLMGTRCSEKVRRPASASAGFS